MAGDNPDYEPTAADTVTSTSTGGSNAIVVGAAGINYFASNAPTSAVVGTAFSLTVKAYDHPVEGETYCSASPRWLRNHQVHDLKVGDAVAITCREKDTLVLATELFTDK